MKTNRTRCPRGIMALCLSFCMITAFGAAQADTLQPDFLKHIRFDRQSGMVNISYTMGDSGEVLFRILDFRTKALLLEKSFRSTPGTQVATISMDGLPKGLYTVEFSSRGVFSNRRLLFKPVN